jgi:hypothetical protein
MLDKEKKGFVTLDDLAARAAKKQVRLFEVDVAAYLIVMSSVLNISLTFISISHLTCATARTRQLKARLRAYDARCRHQQQPAAEL